MRDNDLLELPREIGELTRLRELHIQNNRLTVIPPEIANLELYSNKSVFKMEENPWVQPIDEQYMLGIGHVLEYIKTEAYRMWVDLLLSTLTCDSLLSSFSLYNRHVTGGGKSAVPIPPRADKTKKLSRARS